MGEIMYICICNAVRDKEIQQAIEAGYTSYEDLQNVLSVGTCCGGCQPMVEDYLGREIDSRLFVEVA